LTLGISITAYLERCVTTEHHWC